MSLFAGGGNLIKPRSEFFKHVFSLVQFLKRLQVGPGYFSLTAFLDLIENILNFFAFSLMFSLAQGFLNSDFNFARGWLIFRPIIKMHPHFFASAQSLFLLILPLTYLVILIKSLVNYVNSRLWANMSARISSRLRNLICNRYLSFGKIYFDNTGSGRISQIILNFSTTLANQVGSFNTTVNEMFLLVACSILMFRVSGWLTLLVFIIAPLVSFISNRLTKNIDATSLKYAEAQIDLNEKIINILQCLPLVKSYAREPAEAANFGLMSEKELAVSSEIIKRKRLISPVEEILVVTALVAVTAAAGYLVSRSAAFKIANIFIYLMLVRMALLSFGSIFKFRLALAVACGPMNLLEEIFSDRGKEIVVSGDRIFSGLQENIRLEHLTFSFPGRTPALKNIKMTIESGRTTAIIGATGSGKTTLANLLLRLYSAPAGQIFIDGTDINEFNRESLVSRMAVVSQEVFLFDDTIKNNVTYGLENIPDGRLWDIFEKIGFSDFVAGQPKKLDTPVGEKGTRLSGGQKQLLALARALLKDFDILILDEATSYLDMKTETRVQKTIEEMTRGKTVIVIAHRLTSIRQAEKVFVLEKGCLQESGTPAELLKRRGKFYEYYESQKIFFADSPP